MHRLLDLMNDIETEYLAELSGIKKVIHVLRLKFYKIIAEIKLK